MLKLSSECRMASFDWEAFRGEPVADEHSVLAAAAIKVADIYRASKYRVYRSAIGTDHPRPGAFQLVFRDVGTPKPNRSDSAYDRLRDLLVAKGVPRDKVAFIHEHDASDDEKARLFAACRDGRVAVALAGTAKMGMGTNVQDRLIAGHHLDMPWRPRDVEQREGRWMRQGNQNEVVSCFAYATERSFSVYGWQTLERKAGFVGQLMRAEPDGPRSIDVLDEEALSYGEVKAIATGDPDFLELARQDDTVARLERTARGHAREQASIARRREYLEARRSRVARDLVALTPAAERVASAAEIARPWRVTIDGWTYDDRGDAARALAPLLGYGARTVLQFTDTNVDVEWQPGQSEDGELAAVVGVRDATVKVEDRQHDALVGALTRVTHIVDGLPARVEALAREEIDLGAEIEQLAAQLGAPFAKAGELDLARERSVRLRTELEQRYSAAVHRSGGGAVSEARAGIGPEEKRVTATRNVVGYQRGEGNAVSRLGDPGRGPAPLADLAPRGPTPE
jgi:hypothetical protein